MECGIKSLLRDTRIRNWLSTSTFFRTQLRNQWQPLTVIMSRPMPRAGGSNFYQSFWTNTDTRTDKSGKIVRLSEREQDLKRDLDSRSFQHPHFCVNLYTDQLGLAPWCHLPDASLDIQCGDLSDECFSLESASLTSANCSG